jgi:hypothetical protein
MLRRKPPPDSLAALAHAGQSFFLQCDLCKHFKRIHFYNTACLLGWGATTKEIIARHKCGQCGSKKISIRRE